MQKPTAPTVVDVTASWPGGSRPAPPRSRGGPVDGQVRHHLAGVVGVVGDLAAVQVRGQRDEALGGEAVADVDDVVVEAPPLLDDDDAGAGAGLAEWRGSRGPGPLPLLGEGDVLAGVLFVLEGHATDRRTRLASGPAARRSQSPSIRPMISFWISVVPP